MDADPPVSPGRDARENAGRPRRYRGQKTTSVEVPIFDTLPAPPPPPAEPTS